MSKYFLIISIIFTLPTTILSMDNNTNYLTVDSFKGYQNEDTPKVSRRKNTPCNDAIKFNDLINKFGQAGFENNKNQQDELYKEINMILKDKNKLNGYYPALALRNLKISSIFSGTPLQSYKNFAACNISPIKKDAYLELCEYITRETPLHKHILFLQQTHAKTNQIQ